MTQPSAHAAAYPESPEDEPPAAPPLESLPQIVAMLRLERP